MHVIYGSGSNHYLLGRQMLRLDQFSESKMAASQRDIGQYVRFDLERLDSHATWVVEGG